MVTYKSTGAVYELNQQMLKRTGVSKHVLIFKKYRKHNVRFDLVVVLKVSVHANISKAREDRNKILYYNIFTSVGMALGGYYSKP